MHKQLKDAVAARGLEFDVELFEDQSDDPDEQEDGLQWLGVVEIDEECSLVVEGRDGRIDVYLRIGGCNRWLQVRTVSAFDAVMGLFICPN